MRASYTSRETRDIWALLTGYERFKQAVSLALTALVSVLIIVTILGLTYRVCTVVVFEIIDPKQMEIFQSIFGMVMTVLIDLGACCLPRQVARIQDRPPVERQMTSPGLICRSIILSPPGPSAASRAPCSPGVPIACWIIQMTCCVRIGNIPAMTFPSTSAGP